MYTQDFAFLFCVYDIAFIIFLQDIFWKSLQFLFSCGISVLETFFISFGISPVA